MRASYEGHRRGGPFVFLLLSAILTSACGAAAVPGSPPPRRADPLPRPADLYQRLGFVSGPPSYAAVGGFATLAGAADSTLVIVSLSLPNNALRFQREGTGFVAEYFVDVMFVRDDVQAGRVQHREAVRVGSFAETARLDESVVFQSSLNLEPGTYEVRFRSHDANSSRGFRATDTLVVPAFRPGAAHLAAPVVVYEAEGRTHRGAMPALITNPRRTAAYGGERPRVYLEAYGPDDASVRLQVRDDTGEVVWNTAVRIGDGGNDLRYALVEVPSELLPLGQLTLELVTADGTTLPSPLVLTISDQWLASNFDEVLQFVRYIATDAELDSLATGTAAERRERWESFWARRDPIAATPGNEFREQFFHRVRYAAENFSEPGRPGWQSDRGEVYVVLGPPDFVRERPPGRSDPGTQLNAVEWVYENTPAGRLQLLFTERAGFGRFELVPGSRVAFRSAAERIRTRALRQS
jgi:GWxTD domain-containing protein